MATPLRYGMTLPNGEPLRWNTPGARWGGTVEEVMAALEQEKKPMAQENRISIVITAQQKADILEAIAALKAKLPFTIGLTNDERSGILKLGDKSVAFDQKCISYMTARPDLVPAYVDLTELSKDRTSLTEVQDIQRALGEVSQALEDTATQIGHEIILPDIAFYNHVGLSAKNHVPGAQAIYDDLGSRFTGGRRSKGNTPPPTP